MPFSGDLASADEPGSDADPTLAQGERGLSLRRLELGGAGGGGEYAAVPIVPANAEPRRLRRQHFLDYSRTGGLADLLGLDDDAVTDLSLHRVLLQALRGLASIIAPLVLV